MKIILLFIFWTLFAIFNGVYITGVFLETLFPDIPVFQIHNIAPHYLYYVYAMLWLALPIIYWSKFIGGIEAFIESSTVKFLEIPLPVIIGTYYVALDLWMDEDGFIGIAKETHQEIFNWTASIYLIIACVSAVNRTYFSKRKDHADLIKDRIISICGSLVEKKIQRFKRALKPIQSGKADTFKTITQPTDQIDTALSLIQQLLIDVYNIKHDQICITIIRKHPVSEKWMRIFDTQENWEKTDPEALMRKASTAKKAIASGEHVFYADKQSAEKERCYATSKRDGQEGNGSIFCYPIKIKSKAYKDFYLISISTYGQLLCSPSSAAEIEACKNLLYHVCSRIELELTLSSIKDLQYEFSKLKTQQPKQEEAK